MQKIWALALPVAAFALVSASRPYDFTVPVDEPTQPDSVQVNYPLIHRVDCLEGRGTAFRVAPEVFLSVAHVTSLHYCQIEGAPVVPVTPKEDDGLDFSVNYVPLKKGGHYTISCEGFQPGHWYWAAGYAGGLPVQRGIAIYATAYVEQNSKERIFVGHHTVIPGMSGGPVMNERGEVVGTVNMYNPLLGLSFSRDLKDTSICKSQSAS